MPLLKDLTAIPERIHQGDFVMQLTQGITAPEQTLRDYVGPPQLVNAFGNALGFIEQAVQTGGSKAATCTAVSAPAKATSWRCSTCCWPRQHPGAFDPGIGRCRGAP